MTTELILERNITIAKFMGTPYVEFHGMLCYCEEDESPWSYDPIEWLNYDTNWSKLMPVVEKIATYMSVYINEAINILADGRRMSSITDLWNWVVECIESINKNIENDNSNKPNQ